MNNTILTKKEIETNVAANFRALREQRNESIMQIVEAINSLDDRISLKRQSITSIEDGLSVGLYNVYLMSKLTGKTMDEIFTTSLAK
jgi:hypothetical protein